MSEAPDVEGLLFGICEQFELWKTHSQQHLMSEAPEIESENGRGKGN
jgi:hypothetical protein